MVSPCLPLANNVRQIRFLKHTGSLSHTPRLYKIYTGGPTYAYDAVGNRLSMMLPASPLPYSWSYGYDANNRQTSITTPDHIVFNFAYDVVGRRTSMDMGNIIHADYAYNAGNQIVSLIYRRTRDNAVLVSLEYSYDSVGQLSSVADSFGAHQYSYDSDGRLISVVHPSSGALAIQNESFTYDAMGNRTADAIRSSYAYDADNKLLSDSAYSYTYDNNGNLIDRRNKSTNEETKYYYNGANQLVRVELPNERGVQYRYDVFGRRIEKTASSISDAQIHRYIYSGENIIAQIGAGNTIESLITHGPWIDEPLMFTRDNNNYYLLADALGTVLAVADAQGDLLERIQYQAYGTPVFIEANSGASSPISLIGNVYAYTAHEYDPEASLHYVRARYYDSDTGRFLQQEPMFKQTPSWSLSLAQPNKPVYRAFNQGIPITSAYKKYGMISQYAYASNNPIVYSDHDGEVYWPAVLLLGLYAWYTWHETFHPFKPSPDHAGESNPQQEALDALRPGRR